ncbi:hypothetical protein Afe04nite_60190 [Asanoa ferruginea]|uniref:hypothetical protein n=1 Tax=Asanoa ferruginea TaxID=53367 RepID=UPI001A571D0D|nr:hypothetical protein [Asanoa ferruginea]GIF51480.1 hypothetical protein Afe04nite_60190 [Asanoa ferruginea]
MADLNAWFSTIHIPDPALPGVLAEFHRRRPETVAALLTDAGFHVLLTTVHEPSAAEPGRQAAYLIATKEP